jgi:hypothetical protein
MKNKAITDYCNQIASIGAFLQEAITDVLKEKASPELSNFLFETPQGLELSEEIYLLVVRKVLSADQYKMLHFRPFEKNETAQEVMALKNELGSLLKSELEIVLKIFCHGEINSIDVRIE